MKAHRDALDVQSASNISGVTISFLDAIREIRAANEPTENHPALLLFLHQMAWLVGRKSLIDGMGEYHALTVACEEACKPSQDLKRQEVK